MPFPLPDGSRAWAIPRLLLGAVALAACASPGGPAPSGGSLPAPRAPAYVAPGASAEAFDKGSEVAVARGAAVRCGWRDLRPQVRGIRSLSLVSPGTPTGEALRAGKLQAPDTKVLEQEAVPDLLEAFEKQGFGRFAVSVDPSAGPSNAMAAIWLEVDGRMATLFLVPGAVTDPRTRDLPKVYEGLKALVLTIHQATPGFSVSTGSGWSDDSAFGRRPPGR